MFIQVTQSDSDLASARVEIFLDGASIGAVGPGQSVGGRCESGQVTARCGLLRADYAAGGDLRLRLQWTVNGMTLEKDK